MRNDPIRGGLAALALSAFAAPASAATGLPAPSPPSAVEQVQYYCPPGYRFSYRWNGCRPNRPPPPAYYAPPPPRYYAPPPVYYAPVPPPPPPRYYAPPPGPGIYFRF